MLANSMATSTTGNSKVTPKMNIINKNSVRYWLGLYSVSSVLPPMDSRNWMACPKLKYATVMPAMKKTSDAETKGMM